VQSTNNQQLIEDVHGGGGEGSDWQLIAVIHCGPVEHDICQNGILHRKILFPQVLRHGTAARYHNFPMLPI